jgi:hypothetical protein
MHKDMREGLRAGVTGIPSFFMAGRLRSGARPLESFVGTIEEELARARRGGGLCKTHCTGATRWADALGASSSRRPRP